MKTKSKFLSVLFVAVLVIVCYGKSEAAEPQKEVPGISGDKILIGASLPLSGPAAYAGRGTLESLIMYYDYINKEQGGVNGRQIKFIAEDDGYDPGKAVQAVRKLVTIDKVIAVAPVIGTPCIMAVRGFLNTEKIVAFNGISGDPFIGNWPYLFGLGTPYEIQAAIGVGFIANDLGAKKAGDSIYMVIPDDAFGAPQFKGADLAAKELGIKLTVEKVPRQTDQFAGVAMNIKRSGARYVMAGTPRTGTAALMREVEAQQLDVTFLGPNDVNTEAAIFDLAGKKYAEKYYGVHSISLWEDENDPLIKWARDRFKAAGKMDVLKEKNFFYVWGLIVAKTVVEGLKRAGPDVSREKLADNLRNMENFDLGGGVAPVTYKGQTLLITGTTARVSKGTVVGGVVSLKPITEQRKSPVAIKLQ